MLTRHVVADSALFAAYGVTAALLLAEGAHAHAGCALVVALIHAAVLLAACRELRRLRARNRAGSGSKAGGSASDRSA